MAILHLVKKYPGALGGDAVVVSSLQKQQEMAGHKVVIVTSNCAEITEGEHVYKVGLRDTPQRLDSITVRRMCSLVALFFRMFVILGKERPDVIHAHSIDMTFFASFAAHFFGIPIIHTFHIVTFYDDTQPLLRRKSELWLAKRAGLASITAPNAYDVKKLRGAGLRQAVLLHNGIDLAFWKRKSRAPVGRIFTFLAVGRLEHQKGYEYLIRAAALLAGATPGRFRVIIVGDGPQSSTLRQLARSLQADHVISLVGRKTANQVRRLLSSAQVAVSASLYETTPITLLEAWAVGVPVIATPVGILRDMPTNKRAAYIVPCKDEHALMETMNRCIIDAPGRRAIADAGQKIVKQYAWPIIARNVENIYRSLT